jgi:hypothetical protein
MSAVQVTPTKMNHSMILHFTVLGLTLWILSSERLLRVSLRNVRTVPEQLLKSGANDDRWGAYDSLVALQEFARAKSGNGKLSVKIVVPPTHEASGPALSANLPISLSRWRES